MENEGAVAQAAGFVAAYVARNTLPPEDVPALIGVVHKALLVATGQAGPEPEPARPPDVSIRRSIQRDHLVCLEDGLKYRSIKRHLRTVHGLSPDDYRAKWSLPHNYPMIAPSYFEVRSALAKAIGLGTRKTIKDTKRETKA